jgi:hypothetical protein
MLASDDPTRQASFTGARSVLEIAPHAIRQALPIKRRLD